MAQFITYLQTLVGRKDEKGATMVEYGLLVGLISIAAIAAILLIGPQLVTLFTSVKDALVSANA